MCGIAGILDRDPAPSAAEAPLERMRAALGHRGPDATGTWRSPDGHAAFAHTRLSILDLSPAGNQPMSAADGRYTITYNGEIYNFPELRAELEASGVRFHTRTDTEVILRAYEAWGAGCVQRLRGMFAFAIWDARERTCLLARDRFGIKPLFYHATGGRLVFASEIRALLASGLVPREVDPDGVYGYFRSGSVAAPRTLLTSVASLEAGHHLAWRDGAAQARQYWDLHFADGDASPPGAAVELTRAALLDSVRHHFLSDVPVGIFLSGGVDSTALVALARQVRSDELRTFSIAFPGTALDEAGSARRTAGHFGTAHTEWALDAAAGRALFEEHLAASDQPSIDGLNTFAVSKLAHESGTKVVMSGLGGDELFGGYPSFRAVPRLAAWRRRAQWAGPLRPLAGRLLEYAGDPRWRRVGDLLGQPPGLGPAYSAFRGIFTRREARTLAQHYTGDASARADDAGIAAGAAGDPTPEDTVSRLELTRYLRHQLLRDGDMMSMAWSVELRVPFIDAALVDTLSRISARDRIRDGKALLLRAVPEIPAWVAGQPKRGFLLPMQDWMSEDGRSTLKAVGRPCPVPTGTWYRAWCVYALDRWLDRQGLDQDGRRGAR